MEEGARMAGLDVIVNSVGNTEGRTAGVFVGDLVKAHRAAVELARQVYITEAPTDVDIGVFNAFPEDTELCQARKALNVWTGNMNRRLVRDGGKVVIVSATSDGQGFHSLSDPGMRLYQMANHGKAAAEIFAKHQMIVFSPNCSPSDLYMRFPRNVIIRNTWEDVLRELQKEETSQAVAVFPNGSLQFTAIG
jgi:nickel-dependent lactate racemase